jgi:hypothetical protein
MGSPGSRFVYALGALVVLLFVGCGGGGNNSRTVSVAITNPISTIVPGSAAVTVGATVTNDGTATPGVTWTLVTSGTTTACSPGCGMLSGATATSVVYTPPATVPANASASIIATSNTDSTKSAVDTFTIAVAALAVTITNPISTIAPGAAAVTLNATVANDGTVTPGVAWTLVTGGTTTDCAPGCGMLSAATTTSVLYTPPATAPATASTSIIATSNTDNTKSATDTFTVMTAAAGDLQFFQGQYAFVLSGFDGSANTFPLTVGGVLTADGMGNVTGEIDVNDNQTVSPTPTTVSGTYTLGPDLRGIITLTTAIPAFSATPQFSFTIDSATNTGYMIAFDSSNASPPAVSGPIQLQTPAALTAIPSGPFIMRLASDDPNRFGLVAGFTIANGGIATGTYDLADTNGGGSDEVDVLLNGAFVTPDASGRGTFSITNTSGLTATFAYYVISANKFYLLENNTSTQSSTQFVGEARTQSLSSLTASSPNGAGIFGLIGGDLELDQDNVLFDFASVTAGNLNITGGTTATVNYDLNDAGSISSSTADGVVTGTVTFDPTKGRGTIAFPNGYTSGFIDSATFYLEANGKGVMLDTTRNTNSTFNEALVGDLTPQTATTAISGTFQGVDLISEEDIPTVIGTIDVTAGNITGTQDGAQAGPVGGTAQDQTLSGTAGVVDANGRSVVTISSQFVGTDAPLVAYAIDPAHFYVIGVDSVNNLTSSLGVFSTQTLPAAQAAIARPKAAVSSGKKLDARRTQPKATKRARGATQLK